MSTYLFYAELENCKPKMWRRFLINEDMTIAQLSYAVLIIFRANGNHLFNIEKPLQKGVAALYEMPNMNMDISNLDMNIIKRYNAAKEKINSVVSLNHKDNQLTVNYDFSDSWHIKLKLEEIYGKDNLKNNNIPCVISGNGYGIVEDCGPHSLMQIAETHNLESVDLSHFVKNELNDMLLLNMVYFQNLYENN